MIKKVIINLINCSVFLILAACHSPYLGDNPEVLDIEKADPLAQWRNSHYLQTDIQLPLTLKYDKSINGTVCGGFIPYGEQIIFATYNGFIYSMQADHFKKSGNTRPVKGISTKPLLFGKDLFVAAEGPRLGLVAYNFEDQKISWRQEKSFSVSTPVVWENRLFFAQKDGLVRCFNLQTKREIWRYQAPESVRNNFSFDGTYLYLLTAKGTLNALVPESGTVAWAIKSGEAVISSPLLFKNYIWIATLSGKLIKINLKTREQSQAYNLASPIFVTPSSDGKLVFVTGSDGHLVALDALTNQLIWEQRLAGPPSVPVLVLNTKLVIATAQKRLYVLDKSSGALLQDSKLESRISCLPLAYKNGLIVGMDFHKLAYFSKANEID